MKKILFIVTTCVISIVANGQDQYKSFISGGATYVDNNVKYYGGIGMLGIINNYVAYQFDLQSMRFQNDSTNLNYVTVTMAPRFIFGAFSVNAGLQVGVLYNGHVYKESPSIMQRGRAGLVAGLNYRIKRFELTTRYYYLFTQDYMIDNASLGLNFYLKR